MTKLNKISLLTVLAAVCSLSSCVTTDLSLGADLVPEDRNIQIQVSECDINLGQRYPDSLQTSMSGTAIVGSIHTDEFGTVTIGTSLTVTPATDSIYWGGEPKFVSMRLSIPVSTCQVMDDSQKYIPQNIYARKLLVEMDSTHIYSNSIKDSDIDTKLCSIGPAIYTCGDSLTMMLTEEFAKPLFALDSAVMDSTELFMKNFYGIHLDCDPSVSGGRLNTFSTSGGTIAFTFNSINYAGHRRDTTVYFYVGDYYSTLKINQDKIVPTCDSCTTTALYCGFLGIKPVIDAKALKKYMKSLAQQAGVSAQAVMVSKAQFEFPFENLGTADAYDNWPSNMYLCRRLRDTSGIVYYTPISEIYSSNYDLGTINMSRMVYAPDAALYIQSLANLDESDIDDTYDLWLIPTVSYTSTSTSSSYSDYYSYYYYYYYGYDPYSTTSSTTYYYMDNVNYLTCHLYGPKAERHPKLRVTFTILK